MTKWDKKAKNYSRYNEDMKSFENRIFDTLDSLHVDFNNKTLLDIGCGTGVYTLHLAKKCLHVKGIDSSKEMLELLKKDAKKLNLTNIETQISSWDKFETTSSRYDYALCTMSPALKDNIDFQKMNDCADKKIYLGWAGKRDSEILNKLFEVHGSTYRPSNGAKKLKNWLETNNHSYKLFPFEEIKIRTRKFTEAIENFSWHLEVRGLTPDIDKIENVLDSFCDKNENITETTINHITLIIW